MRSRRTSLLVLGFVGGFACCAQAAVMSATTPVSAKIIRPASVQIVSPLVLPTVTTTTVMSGGAANATALGARAVGGRTGATAGSTNGASPPGNATLTIHGQTGDAVSMAVPESFTVVRTGGTEALTVKTNTNAEYGLSQDGVVLGGTIMGSDTMSVNVGGAISLASSDRAAPGAYEGLLVVVVQYN